MRPKKITERQLVLDPKHIGSYHNLALIHQERGQIKEGLNIIKMCQEFESQSSENKSINWYNVSPTR